MATTAIIPINRLDSDCFGRVVTYCTIAEILLLQQASRGMKSAILQLPDFVWRQVIACM
jgi:hypothetical protein